MTETFWQKAADDPTAIATFVLAIFTLLLALTTVAAIVVPIVQKRREAARDAQRARTELLSLLTAIMVALGRSTAEAVWSASAGIDIVITRILQPDVMGALPPPLGQRVINVIMRAARHLHNDDIREIARRNPTIVRGLQTEATAARTAIQAVQVEIQALDKPASKKKFSGTSRPAARRDIISP